MALPLIPLALAGGALLFLSSSKKEGTSDAPSNTSALVKGKSGTVWETRWIKRVGDYVYIDIFLSGRRILAYKQKGSDKDARTLLGYPPGTSASVLSRARSDFGV
jgi:hypothetical protein